MIDGQALGDRSEDVRPKMLEAATVVIDLHGKEHLSKLIAMFEAFFSNSQGSTADDGITEAVVILLVARLVTLTPRTLASARWSTVSSMLSRRLRSLSNLLSPTVCRRSCGRSARTCHACSTRSSANSLMAPSTPAGVVPRTVWLAS